MTSENGEWMCSSVACIYLNDVLIFKKRHCRCFKQVFPSKDPSLLVCSSISTFKWWWATVELCQCSHLWQTSHFSLIPQQETQNPSPLMENFFPFPSHTKLALLKMSQSSLQHSVPIVSDCRLFYILFYALEYLHWKAVLVSYCIAESYIISAGIKQHLALNKYIPSSSLLPSFSSLLLLIDPQSHSKTKIWLTFEEFHQLFH